jgi:hypothetical protein
MRQWSAKMLTGNSVDSCGQTLWRSASTGSGDIGFRMPYDDDRRRPTNAALATAEGRPYLGDVRRR